MKIIYLIIPVLFLGFASCTSYYSSAILSHEEIKIPQPDFTDSPDHEGGVFLKICPTSSQFTYDSTQSLQAGFMHSLTIPAGEISHFQLAGALSAYGALTYVSEYSESGEDELLTKTSYGFTGQGDFRYYVGGENKFFLGANGLYNYERGDYRDYRKELAEENIYKVDLSPRGESFCFMVNTGYVWIMEGSPTISFDIGYGYAYPDMFDKDFTAYIYPMIKASVTYRNDILWVWTAVEKFSYLNIGLNTGVGFFLY